MQNLLRRIAAVIVLLLGVAACVRASEQLIASFDFSERQPADRKRQPEPFPPGSTFAGKCGGVLGNPPVQISLVSFDKGEYSLGASMGYTLLLTNTGPRPVKVPIAFSLAELEPPDPNASYSYSPLEIWLNLVDSDKHQLAMVLMVLYSSDEDRSTEWELRAGESIEIRGRSKLEPADPVHRRYWSDFRNYSDLELPLVNATTVNARVGYWRGDTAHFDGRTHHEYMSCHTYETQWTDYTKPIRLLPSPPRK